RPPGDGAVTEVEAEAPTLDRLATAFVLARADAGVERVEELVVATEESLAVDGIVAALDPRLASRGDDHDTVMHLRERGRELEPQLASFVRYGRPQGQEVPGAYLEHGVGARILDRESAARAGRRLDDARGGVRRHDRAHDAGAVRSDHEPGERPAGGCE